jgi:hypothetical protein
MNHCLIKNNYDKQNNKQSLKLKVKLSLSLLTSSVFCATTASAADTQKLLRGAIELASDSKYNLDGNYDPFVAAQASETELTTTDLYAKISSFAAQPGFNVEGDSVFTNFVNAFNDKQFFALGTGILFMKSLGRNLCRTLYRRFSQMSTLIGADVISYE